MKKDQPTKENKKTIERSPQKIKQSKIPKQISTSLKEEDPKAWVVESKFRAEIHNPICWAIDLGKGNVQSWS